MWEFILYLAAIGFASGVIVSLMDKKSRKEPAGFPSSPLFYIAEFKEKAPNRYEAWTVVCRFTPEGDPWYIREYWSLHQKLSAIFNKELPEDFYSREEAERIVKEVLIPKFCEGKSVREIRLNHANQIIPIRPVIGGSKEPELDIQELMAQARELGHTKTEDFLASLIVEREDKKMRP